MYSFQENRPQKNNPKWPFIASLIGIVNNLCRNYGKYVRLATIPLLEVNSTRKSIGLFGWNPRAIFRHDEQMVCGKVIEL
jgi:hypothetical protein